MMKTFLAATQRGASRIAALLVGLALASGGANARQPGGWTFEAMPYLWAAGMKGDVGIGRVEVDGAEATFSDIAKSLRAGFMGSFEGRKGRYGFFTDVIYMKLHQQHPAMRVLLGDVDAKVTQQGYTLAGTWRASQGATDVDLFAGARANYVKLDLDVASSALAPQGRSRVQSRDWVDGFAGIRIRHPLSERWSLAGYADIGAGGSDFTWQAMAGVVYALSPATTAKLGVRYLKVDYDKGDFLYNILSGGAFAGISLHF